jgi:hypothetical protein
LLRVAALLRLRRAPREKWFALICAIDAAPRSRLLIGRSRTLRAASTGTLRCFANDTPGFYWNNAGSVELTVIRLL